jgi:hypothetical protein
MKRIFVSTGQVCSDNTALNQAIRSSSIRSKYLQNTSGYRDPLVQEAAEIKLQSDKDLAMHGILASVY